MSGVSLSASGILHLPLIASEGRNITDQAEGIFDQIQAILERFGGTLSDIARTTIYVTNMERDWLEMGHVHGRRLAKALPAAAMVQVPALAEPWMFVAIQAEGHLNVRAAANWKELHSSGGQWEVSNGYSRAVRCENFVRVAGTTAQGGTIEEQTQNTVARIEKALLGAGSSIFHAVNMVVYLKDIPANINVLLDILEKKFGKSTPTLTVVQVTTFIEPWISVEIQLDAVISSTEESRIDRFHNYPGSAQIDGPWPLCITTNYGSFLSGIRGEGETAQDQLDSAGKSLAALLKALRSSVGVPVRIDVYLINLEAITLENVKQIIHGNVSGHYVVNLIGVEAVMGSTSKVQISAFLGELDK